MSIDKIIETENPFYCYCFVANTNMQLRSKSKLKFMASCAGVPKGSGIALSKAELANKINIPIEVLLSKDQRIKQNEFWQPVWSNRAGKEINTKTDFLKMQTKEHQLKR